MEKKRNDIGIDGNISGVGAVTGGQVEVHIHYSVIDGRKGVLVGLKSVLNGRNGIFRLYTSRIFGLRRTSTASTAFLFKELELQR